MPSVDVYKNFLKRSQAVAGGGHPPCMFASPPLLSMECVVKFPSL